jgi:uncharacterized glyoxalase superfamily protein PhnB
MTANPDTPHPPSAPDYGRSLRGLGVNLLVQDVAEAVRFATEVLHATTFFATDAFAAMKLNGCDFMFHADHTFRDTPLAGILKAAEGRGIGVELRAYGVDPDAAEARARAGGWTILGGSLDKPHGLRECLILDQDGYLWVPSLHLPPEA